MINGFEIPKQRLQELLWIFRFDTKIISNVYVSISWKKYSNLFMTWHKGNNQNKKPQLIVCTLSCSCTLWDYVLSYSSKIRGSCLMKCPQPKTSKFVILFFHFMLHKYYSITFSNSRPLVYINIGHLLEKWQILKHFVWDISSSIKL